MRYALLPAVLLVAGTCLGCQHQPTITYPKLVEAGPIEGGFDCAALNDAILKTEAVRWVMREDGARLLTPDQRVARTAADVTQALAAGAACFFCFSPVSLGDAGHAALNRADHRLLSLLQIKKNKACVPRPSAVTGMTDMDLRAAVAELMSKESTEELDAKKGELQAQRTWLLDQLRP